MNRQKVNSIVKQVVKLSLTVVALVFVFRKIDIVEFKNSILGTDLLLFALAFLTFNLSKIVAAFRFKHFLKPLLIHLDNTYNLLLNYVGMFYNLFLPGSIGGDGYKVYILKQQYKGTQTKYLVAVSLLDRLSGLALLFVMACLLMIMSSFDSGLQWLNMLLLVLAFLTLPVFYLFVRLFFSRFQSTFLSTSHFSLWVQLGQVLCAFCLLISLGISDYYTDYLTLFMISSVVAVLPFTIGGVGARELVFLYGFQYLHIEEGKAIAFTILFFIVTALSSFIGLFFTYSIDREHKTSASTLNS